ncbi:MAG: hypothetical protein AB1726_17380 [Planctomycetota bacterium]
MARVPFPVLGLLLPLRLAAPSDDDPARWPRPHLGTVEVVRQESTERNAVLAIFVIQEGEEANDRFRNGVFRHPEIAARCAELLVLLVNDGDHPPRTIREKKDGEVVEREVCSAFGTPTCDDHRRWFQRVFQDYQEGDVLRTPQLLLVLPDGKLHARIVDEHDVPRIAAVFDRAREVAGPSVRGEALGEVRAEGGAGRAALARCEWLRAFRAWNRVHELAPAGPWAAEAKEGLAAALEGLRGEIAAARARLEAGEIAAGYGRLLELCEELRGSPLEKDAVQAIRAAEKNPAWKEEIRRFQREAAAEAIWQELLAALAAERERAVERLARQILARFGDTKAAARVRERFPDLVEGRGGGARALDAARGGR